jgi:hypothetical protein
LPREKNTLPFPGFILRDLRESVSETCAACKKAVAAAAAAAETNYGIYSDKLQVSSSIVMDAMDARKRKKNLIFGYFSTFMPAIV